jgi:hypothetical protein
MEELRVTNLLGGALAAISGAVVASFFGVFGTLAGAGVMSIFMALATAGYAHSLATTHRWLRRGLLRKAGGQTAAGTPPARPLRWQRRRCSRSRWARSPRWRRPPDGCSPACSAAHQHEGGASRSA